MNVSKPFKAIMFQLHDLVKSKKKAMSFCLTARLVSVPKSLNLSGLSTTNSDVVFSAITISFPPGEIRGEDKV